MKATVVTAFIDEELKRKFKIGSDYPVDKVNYSRISLLSKPHPKTGKIYLFVENDEQTTADAEKADEAADTSTVTGNEQTNEDAEAPKTSKSNKANKSKKAGE